jgi:hypothetical protein
MASASHVPSQAGWWRRDLVPLGVPTVILADHPGLLEAACAAYADWAVQEPNEVPTIEIWLLSGTLEAARDGIHVEGPLLALAGSGFEGGADARTGRGWCNVSAALSVDGAALTSDVIEPILLFLLARMGRPPLHAAGILLGDTAVLLAGPSGSGKSTLALAAAAQRLPVLSDDTVYLQLAPTLRVWSFAHPVHVFADEAPPGDHAIRIRAGKRKAAIEVKAARGLRHADQAALVLLTRGSRLSLDPIGGAVAAGCGIRSAAARIRTGCRCAGRKRRLEADADQ